MGKKSRRIKTKQTAEELAQIKLNIEEQISISNEMGHQYISKKVTKLGRSKKGTCSWCARTTGGYYGMDDDFSRVMP